MARSNVISHYRGLFVGSQSRRLQYGVHYNARRRKERRRPKCDVYKCRKSGCKQVARASKRGGKRNRDLRTFGADEIMRRYFQRRTRTVARERARYARALARVSRSARRDAFAFSRKRRPMESLAGWRGKIRFERASGRFRLGSLVLRINQLCLSVFHRAGGELISFPLNTNFFSGRKPISIKMARAFRILPDYKRLPPTAPSQIRSSTALALQWRSYTPLPLCRIVSSSPQRLVDPFLFFPRSASIGCGCSCIERLDRRIVNTGAGLIRILARPFVRPPARPHARSSALARYSVNLVIVYIVFRAANYGISRF